MTSAELLHKATKAAYDYKSVYGKFPNRIGIEASQIGLLPPYILFPLLPEPTSIFKMQELSEITSIAVDRHEMRCDPVYGKDIARDEVYFDVPGAVKIGQLSKVMNGALVAKLAKEFE